jgi:polar amino acid transport system substrate-binding protein
MPTYLKLTALIFLLHAVTLNARPIIIGAEDSWPPYSDRNGQGISTNIIQAAFAKSGEVPEIHVRAYARVLQEIKTGKLDAGYNVTRQASTEKNFIFGDEPLFKANAYWYFFNSNKTYASIEAIPNNTKVGVIIDYEYGDAYEKQRQRFIEIKVARQSQLIKMLQQGRIEAALMFEEEANHTLKELGLAESTIQRGFLNHTSDIYLAFSRQHPASAERAKLFDKGIRELKKTGEYQKLLTPLAQ